MREIGEEFSHYAPSPVCVFPLRVKTVDGGNMIGNHAIPITLLVIHRVAILASLTVAAGKRVAVLPKQIGSNALGRECRLLPGVFDCAIVVASVCIVLVM
jgi:hypothetical protein